MATLSVKFKGEVPQAREVVGPLTNHAVVCKNAASEDGAASALDAYLGWVAFGGMYAPLAYVKVGGAIGHTRTLEGER